MKKNAFTLVELLVTIVLIGLLIVIAVPSSIAISNKIKEKILDSKIELIQSAAIEWGQNNKSKIPIGKSNCSSPKIINDDKVSHCMSISLSELLNQNALEEDKIIDDKKALINPITNEPLNDCSVEIYIKNKMVYALYNINATNCGYENIDPEDNLGGEEENEIPYMLFEDEDLYAQIDPSIDILDLYKTNPNIFDAIKNGDCIAAGACELNKDIYDGLKLIKGSDDIYIRPEEDVKVSDIVWNSSSMSWKYTFTFTGNHTTVENAEKISPITRTIYLKDWEKPIIINKDYQEISEDEVISFKDPDFTSCGNNPSNYYIFDNFDGITPLSENAGSFSSDKIEIALTDESGNSNSYTLGRYYIPTIEVSGCPTSGEYEYDSKFSNCAGCNYSGAGTAKCGLVEFDYNGSTSPSYANFYGTVYDNNNQTISGCTGSKTLEVWWSTMGCFSNPDC